MTAQLSAIRLLQLAVLLFDGAFCYFKEARALNRFMLDAVHTRRGHERLDRTANRIQQMGLAVIVQFRQYIVQQ